MSKVYIYICSGGEESLLDSGECIEECIYEELKDAQKTCSDKNRFASLFKEIHEENKDILHLFYSNVFLDFEFAKQLHLYDTIEGKCFQSDTEIGKEFIDFIDYSQFQFILYFRKWFSKDEIKLEFLFVSEGYDVEGYLKLIKGEIELA